MIHKLLTSLAACALTLYAAAQTTSFTVAAMNVDGLPKEINYGFGKISLNPDAKGSAGAQAISRRLATKDYDIIGLSEDFNYHGSLMSAIGDKYDAGTHRGSIDAGSIVKALFNGATLDTDGLGLLWKKGLNISCESWTRWSQWHGKTEDGADGLIKKGFRYYLADMGNNQLVDLYILHMDAETTDGDIAAREAQMQQLAYDILHINPSHRPKIVMGDTNCRYTRDHLKTLFIDIINADPRYTIKDAWIEKCKSNAYPAYGSNALMVYDLGYVQGEIVDKIFYINPKHGMQLTLNRFFVDTDFNGDDGQPLADHYPVVAKFTAKGTLYDPASYWSGGYDTDAYRAYAQAYDALLPLTRATLKSPLKEELATLLTERADAASGTTARIATFRQHLKDYLAENNTDLDQTSKLANPSFEQGVRLVTGDVQGWTVTPDAWEAFISGIEDNAEGAAIRNFHPHDGNYVFNTWGGTPANGFFCRQEVTLSAGWYRLEATISTDGDRSVNLRFGDALLSSGPRSNRLDGCRLELITYHTGGKVTIGAESNDWFEADDFRLYRYKAVATAIDEIPVEDAPDPNSSFVTRHSSLYDTSGRLLSHPRRGLNIIRYPNGQTRKVVIR